MGSVDDSSAPSLSRNDPGSGAEGEDIPPVIAEDAASIGGNSEKDSVLDGNPPERKKVEVLLRAVGSAPVRKQKRFRFHADQPLADLMKFIAGEKYLKLTPDDSLFVYVNQAFAPSPDQTLENLYDCFGVEGKLVLHYSLTKAWG